MPYYCDKQMEAAASKVYYFLPILAHMPILEHLAGVGQPAHGLKGADFLALFVAVRPPRIGISFMMCSLHLGS
jgi:hypothetical protein